MYAFSDEKWKTEMKSQSGIEPFKNPVI